MNRVSHSPMHDNVRRSARTSKTSSLGILGAYRDSRLPSRLIRNKYPVGGSKVLECKPGPLGAPSKCYQAHRPIRTGNAGFNPAYTNRRQVRNASQKQLQK